MPRLTPKIFARTSLLRGVARAAASRRLASPATPSARQRGRRLQHGALALAARDPYTILRGVMRCPRGVLTRKGRESMHFRRVTLADLLPSAMVGTTRDIIQLLDGNNVNWATVRELGRAKGLSKANWDRRERQQTLAPISSGDIRSLLNIVETATVLQGMFSALAPWSSYIAAR
jgi:hypothetical protein